MNINSKNDNRLVNISVVVAAKNETENIASLISSIKNFDYPDELFEVIIVDDNSDDGTFEKLQLHADETKNLNVKVLKITGQSGKREALNYGISNTRFPYIVITDADCQPESRWLKAHSEKFTEGFDMLFGAAPFKQYGTPVNKITCFENLRSHILTFSFAGLGIPYSAAARNFGFTKRTFELLEGYSRTTETLSGDDDLFLREAVKKKLNVGIVALNDSLVYSETKKNFRDYLNQRARHTQTSIHYPWKQKLLLGFWHLLNLFALFSPLLMPFNPYWFLLFLAKITMDIIMIKGNEKKFGYKFGLPESVLLQIIYELFLIVHFINSRLMKIKWK